MVPREPGEFSNHHDGQLVTLQVVIRDDEARWPADLSADVDFRLHATEITLDAVENIRLTTWLSKQIGVETRLTEGDEVAEARRQVVAHVNAGWAHYAREACERGE